MSYPLLFCKSLLSCLCVLFAACVFAPFSSAVVFVDSTNSSGGNGSSWSSAYRSIEAAVSASGEGEEFWIAAGEYTPLDTILPKKNSQFYGGFSGRESSRGQRDVARQKSVVDGLHRLGHIFTVMHHGVRFDGLEIRNGNALGSGGGGMLVNRASATVVNCTFTNNIALSGGAIYAFDADITISKSTFQGNSAQGAGGRGGAIWTHLQTPTISDSIFTNNSADRLGGAIELNDAPSAVIYNCSFTDNKLTNKLGGGGGGAVSLQLDRDKYPQSSVEINASHFENNISQLEGGGVYSNRVHLVVRESTFVGNTAKNGGAVMVDYKLNRPSRIERCVFLRNKVQGTGGSSGQYATGGAVQSYMRSIAIENSIFADNSSTNTAGAFGVNAGTGEVEYDPDVTATIRNSTFFGNKAEVRGGGICNWGVQTLQVYNSIFWMNKGYRERNTDDLWAMVGSNNAYYSDIETLNVVQLGVNLGNFSTDPRFVDPSADDFRLGDGSPCLDRANGDYLPQPSYDLLCHDRFDYAGVSNANGVPDYADVGALEKMQPSQAGLSSSCPSLAPEIPKPIVPAPSNTSSSLMHVFQMLLQ